MNEMKVTGHDCERAGEQLKGVVRELKNPQAIRDFVTREYLTSEQLSRRAGPAFSSGPIQYIDHLLAKGLGRLRAAFFGGRTRPPHSRYAEMQRREP